MKKTHLFGSLFICALASVAWAQPGGGGGPGGGGRGGFGGPGGGGRPSNPLTEAIDANDDGEITLAELSKAKAILATLDGDKNGKLTEDELRPSFGERGGRGGERGGRGGGAGGRGGRGGTEGGATNTESPLATWMSLDKNKDGKLEKSEVGQRMQTLIARADTNKDGVATKDELAKLAESEAPAGERRGRGGARGGRGEGGPGGERVGRGGAPNPEEFVERAFSFDANSDGQLNKQELGKMAAEMMSRRGGQGGGFGGRGGGEAGGRGGRGGGGGRGGAGGAGGERSGRPARPE